MSINKILNEQLAQGANVQKNLMTFFQESMNATLQTAKQQQLKTLADTLQQAVDTHQIKPDVAAQISAWYSEVLTTNETILKLNQEHLLKNLNEFSHLDSESTNKMMHHYADFLTQMNERNTETYNTTVKTAQHIYEQAFVSFKEKTKPLTDQAAEVFKKSRGKK